MLDKMKDAIRRRLPLANATYSQSGEDRILQFLARSARLGDLSYIDAGASHPVEANNSYLLYRMGYRGICVDPEPGLEKLYASLRPNDQFIAAAVAAGNERELEFNFFVESTINSASPAVAQQYREFGFKPKESRTVPAINLADVSRHLPEGHPIILLLDIEGMEHAVLEKLDFDRVRPALICAEVVQYRADRTPFVPGDIASLMAERGYRLVADTFINQIYMDEGVVPKLRFL